MDHEGEHYRKHGADHRQRACTTRRVGETAADGCSAAHKKLGGRRGRNRHGWPEDWQTNLPALIERMRAHNFPSFLEYGQYPYVTADQVKKALRLQAAFSHQLDQMQ